MARKIPLDILCKACRAIFDNDFAAFKVSGDAIAKAPDSTRQFYSNLGVMSKSAEDGCHLCSIVQLAILTDLNFRRRCGSEQLANSVNDPEDVEVQTRILRESDAPPKCNLDIMELYLRVELLEIKAVFNLEGV